MLLCLGMVGPFGGDPLTTFSELVVVGCQDGWMVGILFIYPLGEGLLYCGLIK